METSFLGYPEKPLVIKMFEEIAANILILLFLVL